MFFRKKVLAAKTESVYGTGPSPIIAGADAVLTKNLSIQPYTGPVVSRDTDRSTLGGEEVINTAPSVQVTFDVEVAGSGTAGTAPAWDSIIKACGFTDTFDSPTSQVAYTPISESFPSVTLEFYLDGQVHTVNGARGSVSFSLTRGQLPVMSFSFTGLYTRPSARTLLVEDVSDYTAPVAVTESNTPTFSVFSTNVIAESFAFDMGNNVVHRNIIGSDEVLITDRNVTGSMAIQAPAIGTKNWFSDAESDSGVTTGAVQLVHGTTAGNIVQFDAPKVQLSSIAIADSDGLVVYNMGTMFIPDSGNDEITITVK